VRNLSIKHLPMLFLGGGRVGATGGCALLPDIMGVTHWCENSGSMVPTVKILPACVVQVEDISAELVAHGFSYSGKDFLTSGITGDIGAVRLCLCRVPSTRWRMLCAAESRSANAVVRPYGSGLTVHAQLMPQHLYFGPWMLTGELLEAHIFMRPLSEILYLSRQFEFTVMLANR